MFLLGHEKLCLSFLYFQASDLEQPKIKIKTDIFKPDDLAHRPDIDKPRGIIKVLIIIS